MLALLASMVIPFATPALAQGGAASPPGANANGLNMSLAVVPTQTHNGSTVGYYITISNNPATVPGLISADAENVVVTFSPPDATGAPGAPVTIATIPSLAVGGNVSYNPGNTPALSVVLNLNPGVTVARGESHFTATLLTDPPATASDTKDIPTNILSPAIAVTKTADVTLSKAGDTVNYTITVTNTGNNTSLSGITVMDTLLGNLTASFPSSLGNGTSATANFPYVVKATDPNPLLNTVTASGADVTGFVVTATANASVTVVTPNYTLTKTASPTSGTVGTVITYTYVITNTGNVTLNKISAMDTLLGNITAAFPASLAPGASGNVTKTRTILNSDVSPINNTVTTVYQVAGLTNQLTRTASASVTIIIPPSQGRWTGGGTIGTGAIIPAGVRVTHGFEFRNDLDKPNNLEVNWGGNRFHMTQLLAANCFMNLELPPPNPPAAPVNEVIATGIGKYNGVAGYTINFHFTDVGEPGLNDYASITITAPDGTVVLQVAGTLHYGNQQAHPDNK